MTKITGIDYEIVSQINELRKGHNFHKIKKDIGEKKLKKFITRWLWR